LQLLFLALNQRLKSDNLLVLCLDLQYLFLKLLDVLFAPLSTVGRRNPVFRQTLLLPRL